MNRLATCILVGVIVAVIAYGVFFQYHKDSSSTASSCSTAASSPQKRKKQPPDSKQKRASKQPATSSKTDEKPSDTATTVKPSKPTSLPRPVEHKDEGESKEAVVMDEGVMKYECNYTESSIDYACIKTLLSARNRLHSLRLIHVYPHNGIGFGNISQRIATRSGHVHGNKVRFYITGTQTSSVDNAAMNETHFSMVTDYDIAGNKLYCAGPVRASSESLTHAMLYELDARIECVVHVHHHELWSKCLNVLPTTDDKVAYGTPEMAKEVERLYRMNVADVQSKKVLVMAGHEDGLIAFGSSVESATQLMLSTYARFCGQGKRERATVHDHDENDDGVRSIHDEDAEDSSSGTGTASSTNSNVKSSNMEEIHIIDDYATPVMGSQAAGNEQDAGSNQNDAAKNGGYVQIDSDHLQL